MGKMSARTIDDDAFNTEKFKLPFYYKLKDKRDFHATLELLTSCDSSEVQRIDLFYTLHALPNVDDRVWFDYFLSIESRLSAAYRINLLKCCSFFIRDDALVDQLKIVYDRLFDETGDESVVFDICFLDTSFFKPLLHSSVHFLRNFNKPLLAYLLEKCVTFARDDDRWMFCVERLTHVRQLTDEEYDKVLTLLSTPALRGRAVDVLLRANDERYVRTAHEFLNETVRFFESENAVHYLELTDDAAQKISAADGNPFSAVIELTTLAQCIADDDAQMQNAQNFARELVCGCFSIRVGECTVTLVNVFLFCWSECKDKEMLTREIFTFDRDLCAYGVLVNLLSCVSGQGCGEFLRVNERLERRDRAVAQLRRERPSDFWEDAEAVEAAIAQLTG